MRGKRRQSWPDEERIVLLADIGAEGCEMRLRGARRHRSGRPVDAGLTRLPRPGHARRGAGAFCNTRRRGTAEQDVGLRHRRGAGAGFGEHPPRHEFADAVDRMAIGDFRQDIAQVGFRVQLVQPGRLHQGVDGRRPFATRIRSTEQVILPANGDAAHSVLCCVVVYFKPSIREKMAECNTVFDGVTERLGQCQFARQFGYSLVRPIKEPIQDCRGLAAVFNPFRRRCEAGLVLNRVDRTANSRHFM